MLFLFEFQLSKMLLFIKQTGLIQRKNLSYRCLWQAWH